MTTTAVPPRSLEDALREETDLAEIGREFSDGVRALVEDSRAEARAAGRQYRVLHRLWQLQEEAREQRWAVEAHWMPAGTDRLGPHSLEPEEQTLRDVADEIGPALRLPAGTALRRVEDAVLLAESLPRVLEAMERGLVGARQAGVLVELWRELVEDARGFPEELRAPVEAVDRIADELLLRAPDCTVAQLRALARRRRAGLLRETEEQRHRLALRDRCVWVEPREDGMAQLCALLDAATAHAVQDRLDTLADRAALADPARVSEVPAPAGASPAAPAGASPEAAGAAATASGEGPANSAARAPERRTVLQLRADVLADLLLDGEPADLPEHLRGIRGHVTVTVPVLALLGDAGEAPTGAVEGLPPTSRCAELEGYGPIPVSLAARIAARAPSWSRILTHPVTGTVLDRDRSTYTVPADLKHRLRARDGTCRFPGCRRRASRCDLDHTVAWADGGRTSADNLAHLCRHHHLLKHRDGPLGRWRVEHVGPGPLSPSSVGLGFLDHGRPDPRLLDPEHRGPGQLEYGRPDPGLLDPQHLGAGQLDPGRLGSGPLKAGSRTVGTRAPGYPGPGNPEREYPEPGHLAPGRPGTGHSEPGAVLPGPGQRGGTETLHQHGVLEWTSPAGQVHRTYPQEHHHPAPDRAPGIGLRPGPRPAPAADPPPF